MWLLAAVKPTISHSPVDILNIVASREIVEASNLVKPSTKTKSESFCTEGSIVSKLVAVPTVATELATSVL